MTLNTSSSSAKKKACDYFTSLEIIYLGRINCFSAQLSLSQNRVVTQAMSLCGILAACSFQMLKLMPYNSSISVRGAGSYPIHAPPPKPSKVIETFDVNETVFEAMCGRECSVVALVLGCRSAEGFCS